MSSKPNPSANTNTNLNTKGAVVPGKPGGAKPLPKAGKIRASRIPLDYYTKSDHITKTRRALILLAIVFAAGYVVVGELGNRWRIATVAGVALSGKERVNPGPVSRVHAVFEQDCQACHTPFESLNDLNAFDSHSRRFREMGGELAGKGGPDGIESQGRCQTCHTGAAHHVSQNALSTPHCGSCHQDHQGRDFDLKRVANDHCTRCHADLSRHSNLPGVLYDDHIDKFAPGSHPDFRLPRKDASGIQFSHHLHLKPGLGQGFTRSKIARADQERYPVNASGLVSLECRSCHVLDAGDLNTAGRPDLAADLPITRGSGNEFLRVNYDRNCAACHPLSVDEPPTQPAGAPGSGRIIAVPHHKQPSEIRPLLEEAYALKAIQKHPDSPQTPDILPSRPGPLSDRSRDQNAVSVGNALRTYVHNAERTLYAPETRQTCALCHTLTRSNGQPLTTNAQLESLLASPDNNLDLKIPPVKIPDIWLSHGRFDHSRHRMLTCKSCHNAAESQNSEDVLIPQASSCMQCHHEFKSSPGIGNVLTTLFSQSTSPQDPNAAPAKPDAGPNEADLRRMHGQGDCVECHRYHNGDNPLQGPGAISLDLPADKVHTWDLTHKPKPAPAPATRTQPKP